MGCCLIQKQSNINNLISEIDLNSHILKHPQQISMYDTNIANTKISDENANIKDKKEKNIKTNKKYGKGKSISSKEVIINNKTEKIIPSGPIFNILKQTVEKYKLNKSLQ